MFAKIDRLENADTYCHSVPLYRVGPYSTKGGEVYVGIHAAIIGT
jgi:hypothetical protein